MHEFGKTNRSVNLHKDVGGKVIDSLEPGYPVTARDYCFVGSSKWLKVWVPARGKRDGSQIGWIDARFVTLDKDRPKPDPLLRTPEWKVCLVVLAVLSIWVLLWWGISALFN